MTKKSDGKNKKRLVTNGAGEGIFYNPPKTIRRHKAPGPNVRVYVPPTRK